MLEMRFSSLNPDPYPGFFSEFGCSPQVFDDPKMGKLTVGSNFVVDKRKYILHGVKKSNFVEKKIQRVLL
jgi:hypothetical protein